MSYNWHGWMAETDNDNADDREGVWYLTIVDPDGEEYAVIMHRLCGGKYPLDGELAQSKVARAETIVAALNASEDADPHDDQGNRLTPA
jgi:hypothetical protein